MQRPSIEARSPRRHAVSPRRHAVSPRRHAVSPRRHAVSTCEVRFAANAPRSEHVPPSRRQRAGGASESTRWPRPSRFRRRRRVKCAGSLLASGEQAQAARAHTQTHTHTHTLLSAPRSRALHAASSEGSTHWHGPSHCRGPPHWRGPPRRGCQPMRLKCRRRF